MNTKRSMLAMTAVLACAVAPSAQAALIGTVPTVPGQTVVPGLVPTGTAPGTLLASLSAPFVSTLGTTAGTALSAVSGGRWWQQ